MFYNRFVTHISNLYIHFLQIYVYHKKHNKNISVQFNPNQSFKQPDIDLTVTELNYFYESKLSKFLLPFVKL